MSARAAEGVAGAWELLARHLPAEALVRVQHARAGDPRERALAQAVVLMDSQPVTDERMRQVLVQLETLARGDDAVAQTAAYLTARVCQTHLFAPDLARAAHAYQDLARRHPESYWGQLAAVKLAVLTLYMLPEPAAPAARVAAAEALLAAVQVPELRRDLLIVIGRGRLFHGLPGVLPPLIEAERIGGLAGVPRADLQVQIGELSRRAGERAQARVYFGKFLEENEVDPRVYAVRRELEAMAAGEQAAGLPAP